jgi:hypothetical protein
MKKLCIIIFLVLLSLMPVHAQENQTTVTVPDVIGLTVPEAAAVLNEAGLRFGEQIIVPPPAGETQDSSAIVEQSVVPGTQVQAGSTVNVTVQHANNTLLLYDDNDITLVNQSNGPLNLGAISFASSNTRFNGGRWGGTIGANECSQLWSVGRTSPKSLDQCTAISHWLTTNQTGEHFWTASNADATFTVNQDGVQRATCNKAQPGGAVQSCALYLAAGGTSESTPYVFLAYTPSSFLILNNTSDKWMPLNGVQMRLPDGRLFPLVTDLQWFDNADSMIGNIYRLAPGQCQTRTTLSASGTPPLQPCDEIGRVTGDSEGPFAWHLGFEVMGTTGNEPAACPPATEGRMTLCIVPR